MKLLSFRKRPSTNDVTVGEVKIGNWNCDKGMGGRKKKFELTQ